MNPSAQYAALAEQAAKAGKWPEMVRYAKASGYRGIFDELAQFTPDAAVPHVLEALKSKPNDLASFIHYVVHYQGDKLSPKTLNTLADNVQDDALTTRNIQQLPQYKPSEDLKNKQKASNFWLSYERNTHPAHFAAIKSLYSGKPETVIDHRHRMGSSHGEHYLHGNRVFDKVTIGSTDYLKDPNSDADSPHTLPELKPSHPKLADAIPHLERHAKDVRAKVLADESIPKRYFKGEPYIQVHRGVAGKLGKRIRDASDHGILDHSVAERTLKLPQSSFSSWSTDKIIANRFASRDIPKHPKNRGVTISKWMPLKNLLHSGVHDVHFDQEHAHPHEFEMVFAHPEGHINVSTKNLSFQDRHEPHIFVQPTLKPKVKPDQHKQAKAQMAKLDEMASIGSLQKSELEKSDTPLYHYSTQNGLTHIDPNFQGTGAPSEENRRGTPEIKRSYYYNKDEPEDIVKQSAKSKYIAHLPSDHRIYDIAADKDQLIPKLKQESMKRQVNQGVVSSEDYLKAIKDAGYHGYHNPSSQIPHALAMFYPLQVHQELSVNS